MDKKTGREGLVVFYCLNQGHNVSYLEKVRFSAPTPTQNGLCNDFKSKYIKT